MRPLVRIARDTNCALVLLHHAGKSEGKYRDSTEIGAAVDVIVEMSVTAGGAQRQLELPWTVWPRYVQCRACRSRLSTRSRAHSGHAPRRRSRLSSDQSGEVSASHRQCGEAPSGRRSASTRGPGGRGQNRGPRDRKPLLLLPPKHPVPGPGRGTSEECYPVPFRPAKRDGPRTSVGTSRRHHSSHSHP